MLLGLLVLQPQRGKSESRWREAPENLVATLLSREAAVKGIHCLALDAGTHLSVQRCTVVISESLRFETVCRSVPRIEHELGWARMGRQSTAFRAQPRRRGIP